MPTLEEKYINAFKELYRKKQGKELSDVEAVKKFNNLITLVKNVYLPIPAAQKAEFEKLLAPKLSDL